VVDVPAGPLEEDRDGTLLLLHGPGELAGVAGAEDLVASVMAGMAGEVDERPEQRAVPGPDADDGDLGVDGALERQGVRIREPAVAARRPVAVDHPTVVAHEPFVRAAEADLGLAPSLPGLAEGRDAPLDHDLDVGVILGIEIGLDRRPGVVVGRADHQRLAGESEFLLDAAADLGDLVAVDEEKVEREERRLAAAAFEDGGLRVERVDHRRAEVLVVPADLPGARRGERCRLPRIPP
jgi:hypothetical protein